jgi:large subunit ribosomal protein L30
MGTPTNLSITLKRSTIGHPEKMRVILLGLGLRKIGQTVGRPDTDQVRGLIYKVRHLVEVSST